MNTHINERVSLVGHQQQKKKLRSRQNEAEIGGVVRFYFYSLDIKERDTALFKDNIEIMIMGCFKRRNANLCLTNDLFKIKFIFIFI